MRRGVRIPIDEARSVLVVPPTWVGDFVMATPALRAIRRRFREAQITFLTEPNLRDLVRGGAWMDECIEWPEKRARTPMSGPYRVLVRELRWRRFDLAILLPNSFRAALIARLAGAKRRVGYARDGRGFLLTDRVPVKNRRGRNSEGRSQPSRNIVANNERFSIDPGCTVGQAEACGSEEAVPRRDVVTESDLTIPLPTICKSRHVAMPLVEYYADLAEFVGCKRPGDVLELFTTSDDDEAVERRLNTKSALSADVESTGFEPVPHADSALARNVGGARPLVVISPGAKYGAAKCWFPERFAETADRIVASHGALVCITCGPGEEPIARRIAECMKHPRVVMDDPRLTLGELKSLIRRADLLICNDAGPRHFAKAFGVPVVTIFGPTHPDWTATSYTRERVVRADLDCSPCQERVCPLGHLNCMRGVSVDRVYAACVGLLGVPQPRAAMTEASGTHD